MNRYYNPVRTIEGAGCAAELTGLLESMGLAGRNVLVLVWSEAVLDLPAFAGLSNAGFTVRTQVFRASNPTVEQLFETYQATRDFAPEAVVAVGGGSIMDVGKSLCCLYGKELPDADALRRLIEEKDYGRPSARWIGVPTTAGTGSEVTCWATIWDPEKDAKRSVECRENYAFAALVDPELAAGMPLPLAVSSALDAAAHAIESYWANGSNAVSRGLAVEAIRTIMGGMDGLLAGTMEAHDAMARGSMMAGLQQYQDHRLPLHLLPVDHALRYPPWSGGEHAAGAGIPAQCPGHCPARPSAGCPGRFEPGGAGEEDPGYSGPFRPAGHAVGVGRTAGRPASFGAAGHYQGKSGQQSGPH